MSLTTCCVGPEARPVRTNIYIDGFNLYYGCLKNTPHKWLDLRALCQVLLPRDTIGRNWSVVEVAGGRVRAAFRT